MIRWLIRAATRQRLRQVAKALADPAATQERLLLGMVRRARQTLWGRQHGFESIRSVRDYQRAVPVCRYEDVAPLWHRAFDGERDICWPGHVRYFALSSGTTAETCKAIPVTKDSIRANFRSALTLMALCQAQAGDEVLAGKTLYFGGCTTLERRGACLQGDSSGIMALHIPRLAWRYRLPERDVAAMTDWEAKVEAICSRYQGSPITMVAGLPSWTLLLFRRLLKVTGAGCVAEVWPRLRAFVHFGMAFEPYRRQFDAIIGRPVAYVDTYSSSEGGLNAIQSEQGDPAMQLELDSGAFYEFVPVGELEGPNPTRLTVGQVELDKPYAVLLTTVSGIWAYDVGDVVRFTSLRPPKIVVAGRTRLALNTFGEHVIVEELEMAAAAAARATGSQTSDFTVAPLLPEGDDPRGAHLWLVEFDGSAPPLDDFAAHLDKTLAEKNLDYKIHRERDFAMKPPVVVALARGTFLEWARRHGRLGGQRKVPRVALSDAMVEELRAISAELSVER